MASTHKPKVIALGLGRTGTLSLKTALEMLGFGPCYHFQAIREGRGKDLTTWNKIGDGNGTTDDIKALLDDFGSATCYPMVLYPDQVYAAYPDAKYILTIRDPAKWEQSIKATILPAIQALREFPSKDTQLEGLLQFGEDYLMAKYHRGRLETHTQQELLDHNERIKNLIPPENLLIYEVGEGWQRLVDFLGVPMPTEPFPHVNSTAQYTNEIKKRLSEITRQTSRGIANAS